MRCPLLPAREPTAPHCNHIQRTPALLCAVTTSKKKGCRALRPPARCMYAVACTHRRGTMWLRLPCLPACALSRPEPPAGSCGDGMRTCTCNSEAARRDVMQEPKQAPAGTAPVPPESITRILSQVHETRPALATAFSRSAAELGAEGKKAFCLWPWPWPWPSSDTTPRPSPPAMWKSEPAPRLLFLDDHGQGRPCRV